MSGPIQLCQVPDNHFCEEQQLREILDEQEVRVLGCLIEKELTTPDYYPLTLNSLTAACNQKSNRDPVVVFNESEVEQALGTLRDKGWIFEIDSAGGRARKYRHAFPTKSGLEKSEMVAISILMLRSAQTVGEIRGRSGRMHKFGGLDEVNDSLDRLMDCEEPWVVRLPRQAGRKENRFMHLLAGEVEVHDEALPSQTEKAAARVQHEHEQFERIDGELEQLRDEIAAIREELNRFKGQFE